MTRVRFVLVDSAEGGAAPLRLTAGGEDARRDGALPSAIVAATVGALTLCTAASSDEYLGGAARGAWLGACCACGNGESADGAGLFDAERSRALRRCRWMRGATSIAELRARRALW